MTTATQNWLVLSIMILMPPLLMGASAPAALGSPWQETACSSSEFLPVTDGSTPALPSPCDGLIKAVQLAVDPVQSPSAESHDLQKRIDAVMRFCSVEIQIVIPERPVYVQDRMTVNLDMTVRRHDNLMIDRSVIGITTQRGIFLPSVLNASHYSKDPTINRSLHSFDAILWHVKDFLARQDIVRRCQTR